MPYNGKTHILSGYRQNLIENAVIVMENGFSNLFPEFIYDFVIRVQIVTNPDKYPPLNMVIL